MPFIQRERGEIVAVFSRPQAGVAEEQLAADSAEIVAFRAARRNKNKEASLVTVRQVLDLLKRKGLVTDTDLTPGRNGS